MAERVPKKEGPPRNRLESWLVRKIQGGGLKTLPRFQPIGVREIQCPEQYARTLLARLRRADDVREAEHLKDDGRSFRSWVESSQVPPSRKADNPSGPRARPGFFA